MRPGNAFVVVLCSLAMVMQAELRSIIAAAGQTSYGGGLTSVGAGHFGGVGGSGSNVGISGAGVGSSGASSYRASATGGSESGGYFSRGSSYSGFTNYNHGGYSPSSGQSDDQQKETKYYYGGKYQGSCVADGLYYRDDTTFVICSNGFPHEQPCPPGTKTSGSPRYQPGYYYGYTDLCSVNLVDYGYGPEYYAPRGYPEEAASGPGRELQSGYGSGQSSGRSANGQGATGYGGLGGGSNGPAASIGSAGGSSSYDRSRSYGVRESDYGLPSGLYGSGASSAGANKNRQYDVSGNGYAGKKDVIQPSAGYHRDPSSASRPAGFGYGDIKSQTGSSLYQQPSAADNSYSSKNRDASFSLSKSPYLGSPDKKFI